MGEMMEENEAASQNSRAPSMGQAAVAVGISLHRCQIDQGHMLLPTSSALLKHSNHRYWIQEDVRRRETQEDLMLCFLSASTGEGRQSQK